VVLVPFLIVGAIARRHSPNFRPWFLYTLIAFAGATLLYPLHVPGGAFIHSAIGLQPHAAILSAEGILLVVGWLAGRRRHWDEGAAGKVFVWGIVGIVIATSVVFGLPVQRRWDAVRQPRVALAAELTRLQVPPDDRILSIDAAGIRYWTGHPGVVTPDDPLDTIEAVARAYHTRWLVLEPENAARALGPILAGSRPAWVGAPVFTVAAPGGQPSLLLYPVCLESADSRCNGT
jgi:hypothetical protein